MLRGYCFAGVREVHNEYSLNVFVRGRKVKLEYEAVNEKIINPNDAHGCVELWLDQIQTIMRKTIAHIFDLSMKAYPETPERSGSRSGLAKLFSESRKRIGHRSARLQSS